MKLNSSRSEHWTFRFKDTPMRLPAQQKKYFMKSNLVIYICHVNINNLLYTEPKFLVATFQFLFFWLSPSDIEMNFCPSMCILMD